MGVETRFFARKASGLVRSLSWSDATVFNIMAMGVNGPFAFIVFAAALFPGVNMALDQIAAVPLVLIVAFTYTFFAVTMPRAGADYVWLSRSLHPGLGFLESFGLVALWISVFGATAPAWFPAGIGGMMINWGALTGNSGLVNYASTFLSPFNMFVIILAIMIVTLLLNLAGTKVLFRFIEACFVGSVLGVIVFLGAFLAIGHNAFVANFNQVSSTSYAAVVNAAQSAGYETGFTASGTAYGAIYAFLTYFGFAWSSFFAGEMKEVYRSQIIAIIGGLLVFAFITWATYQVAYVVIGAPFINGASYLATTGNSAWVLPSAPYLSYLIIFATNNPWIAIIMPFSIMAGAVGYLAAYFGQAIRVIFAWSFDRLLPTAFSNIDQRFHAPRNGILLIAVATLPFMYMGCYTGLLNFLTYASLQLWVTAAIVGVGAAIFPYRRKEIFDKAPKLARTMIGSVPLMTVLGVVTTIVSVVVSAFSALPAFTGAPITPSYLLVVAGIFVFGGIYYAIVHFYNKRRGLDMKMAYREIPPV